MREAAAEKSEKYFSFSAFFRDTDSKESAPKLSGRNTHGEAFHAATPSLRRQSKKNIPHSTANAI